MVTLKYRNQLICCINMIYDRFLYIDQGACMSEQGKVSKTKHKSTSRKPVPSMPWDGIDDKMVRQKAYNLQVPASLYEKMVFISQNSPGGMSVRVQILTALEPFVAAKLKELIRSPFFRSS